MKAKELIPLLSEYFTTWLPDVKGFSKNTITAYQYAFQLLFEFMHEVKGITFEKVTFSILLNGVITEYLAWLELKRKCGAVTRNLRRSAIVSFAKFAVKKAFKESLAFFRKLPVFLKKRLRK